MYNGYVKRIFDADISSALKYEEEHFAENIYLKTRDKDIHGLYDDIGVNNNQFPQLARSYMNQTREVYSRQLLILILIPTLMALLRSVQSVYYFYSLRRLRGNFMIDPLTGVYNRRYLSKLRDTEEVCYILAMDIDNFKTINDTWGHAFGDRVLQECTNQMKLHLREYDFVVRMGGDEFSIFLFKTDRVGAQTASSRLLEKINELEIQLPDNGVLTPSISMGLARCDGNVEMALHQADLNLYASKKKGKNTLTMGDE
ncbi:GGDEF domain-containing protein [uncultured Pluralibacter sp.]|uniref:GGDEF domain-containing protein n=1 Tax=uncultured Pluralibacter sp. TaxID=1490864 RepID=UPI00262D10BC|nr:GGDEF domain-containing protein [uncultured Pluralibacter sp.]